MTACRISWFLLLVSSVVLEAEALVKVIDVTPPVCRVVNESLDCAFPCNGTKWKVMLLITDGNGSGIDIYKISGTADRPVPEPSITVLNATRDENGYNATLLTYTASCCENNVEISAVDKNGNVGRCNFSIRWPSTTVTSQTTKKLQQPLQQPQNKCPPAHTHSSNTLLYILCSVHVLAFYALVSIH